MTDQGKGFEPRNPGFAARVESSFQRQIIAKSMGLELSLVAPGHVVIEMDFNPEFVQQHGFHHAGVAATGMDSACGYAAMSLMPADGEVLTAEFKTSLLAPAEGRRFRFEGRVIKPGRTLSFCEGRTENEAGRLIATMSATMVTITGRAGVAQTPGPG